MDEIELRLRASGGAIARRSHRDLSGRIDRMLRAGSLTALFPGVYCATGEAQALPVRLMAAALWAGPDAVFTGRSAAKLTFWPACPVPAITLALPSQSKRSVPGATIVYRSVPPWLTRRRGPLTMTAPALTAVDLCEGPEPGRAIDEVLLTREASLAQLWEALQHCGPRRGNRLRAAVLRDSRDEPWSEAERLQHRLLRVAGISGWRTNRWVATANGGYFADVLFEHERLLLEVDGWQTHGTREAFEGDRRRRNALVLAGYRVLNFTWRQLSEDPDWVLACIRTALASGDAGRRR